MIYNKNFDLDLTVSGFSLSHENFIDKYLIILSKYIMSKKRGMNIDYIRKDSANIKIL